jgi:hypothetical protein
MDKQYLPWLKRNEFKHLSSHPTGKGSYDETYRREWTSERRTYMLNLTIEPSGNTSAFLTSYNSETNTCRGIGEKEFIEFDGVDLKRVYSKAKRIIKKEIKRLEDQRREAKVPSDRLKKDASLDYILC